MAAAMGAAAQALVAAAVAAGAAFVPGQVAAGAMGAAVAIPGPLGPAMRLPAHLLLMLGADELARLCRLYAARCRLAGSAAGNCNEALQTRAAYVASPRRLADLRGVEDVRGSAYVVLVAQMRSGGAHALGRDRYLDRAAAAANPPPLIAAAVDRRDFNLLADYLAGWFGSAYAELAAIDVSAAAAMLCAARDAALAIANAPAGMHTPAQIAAANALVVLCGVVRNAQQAASTVEHCTYGMQRCVIAIAGTYEAALYAASIDGLDGPEVGVTAEVMHRIVAALAGVAGGYPVGMQFLNVAERGQAVALTLTWRALSDLVHALPLPAPGGLRDALVALRASCGLPAVPGTPYVGAQHQRLEDLRYVCGVLWLLFQHPAVPVPLGRLVRSMLAPGGPQRWTPDAPAAGEPDLRALCDAAAQAACGLSPSLWKIMTVLDGGGNLFNLPAAALAVDEVAPHALVPAALAAWIAAAPAGGPPRTAADPDAPSVGGAGHAGGTIGPAGCIASCCSARRAQHGMVRVAGFSRGAESHPEDVAVRGRINNWKELGLDATALQMASAGVDAVAVAAGAPVLPAMLAAVAAAYAAALALKCTTFTASMAFVVIATGAAVPALGLFPDFHWRHPGPVPEESRYRDVLQDPSDLFW